MPAKTSDGGIIKTEASPHCRLRSVDLSSVRWTEGFWADQFQRCKEVTLPHLFKLADDPEMGHALMNMRIAAGLEEGEFAGTNWQDAWVYKWLESAAAVYGVTHDAALAKQMDEVIEIIAKAQEPDGYIATQIQLREGWKRFEDPHRHELYTMGHLTTAACIHHRITGETDLLDVATKCADYLYETFKDKDPKLAHFPYNPSLIMGAVELYRTTGEKRYLDLANTLIDMRGAFPGGSDQCQDRIPLREEDSVVGHAVFYTYLYAGAADAYMETGDRSLLDALDRLWHDLVEKKMYIHGGCCPLHRGLSIRNGNVWAADDVHEAASSPYHLPNATAYNETCSQVGCFMWNFRMLEITGDARFADVMERTIYNSILSGIGLDGASWFYTNVLRWYGSEHVLLSSDDHQRFQPGDPAKRRAHICCPTNLLRTVAEMHGYFYNVSGEGVWVNHYGGSTLDCDWIKLIQDTNYPWDGNVKITIERPPESKCAIMLRIPGWCNGAGIKINGEPAEVDAPAGTYATLNHEWSAGDVIELTLPMAVRLVEGHPKIEETRGQVAVLRGPLVYCLESPDLPDGVNVPEVYIPRDMQFTPRHDPDLLDGVTVLEGTAKRIKQGDWDGKLYRRLEDTPMEDVPIRLIPYYAWCNRGISEMTIWMPLA
ncbi:MAG: glycoside hydrolase family 127 protein [Planctomycetes bacterium]|nr:glycoside hydrolase family 127 protein [Planctomycetota bacterium]